MWKRYGHNSLICLALSNKISTTLILFILINYLSISATNCSWDTWNVTLDKVCVACRNATVENPSILRSKKLYSNATFGGQCEEEEPKKFICEPNFWEEESCTMSNAFFC